MKTTGQWVPTRAETTGVTSEPVWIVPPRGAYKPKGHLPSSTVAPIMPSMSKCPICKQRMVNTHTIHSDNGDTIWCGCSTCLDTLIQGLQDCTVISQQKRRLMDALEFLALHLKEIRADSQIAAHADAILTEIKKADASLVLGTLQGE